VCVCLCQCVAVAVETDQVTHVALAGVGGADVSADVEVPNEAVAPHRVDSGSEGQHGTVLGRGKFHLSQIVDEEVQFGGDAAQTGLNQPAGGHRRVGSDKLLQSNF